MTHNSDTRQQVRRVLLITLLLNFAVAIGKIVLGLLTGALSITADGFHSLVDGSSNIIALVANRIAERPPDEQHPYGHRRFETIAALAIGVFLLLTAWEIISSAFERLGGAGEAPEITPVSFVVMLATLAVNLFVSRYEAREGRRLKSEILTADAAHTSTDVFVTVSVLASMAAITLFGWIWVDTAAAIVIVALILRAAWHVLRQTGSVLVDTAPYPAERLTSIVQELPSVEEVLRARSRGPADAAYIDIDVQVAPETTTSHTAAIADAIRDKLNSELDGVAEIEVHFAPNGHAQADFALTARAAADALGLLTHEVYESESDRGKVLELHVEVPSGLTLDEAHQRVSQLEHDIQQKLPSVVEVITHIEPRKHTIGGSNPEDSQCSTIEKTAWSLLRTRFPHVDWHDLRVRPQDGRFALTMHVALPHQITIEAAHDIAEAAETALRSEIPELERVTIHTEPPDTA